MKNPKNRVHVVRFERGIGQREVSTCTGMSQETLSHIECARRPATAEQRKLLCDFFGMAEADLFPPAEAYLRIDELIRLAEPATRKARRAMRGSDETSCGTLPAASGRKTPTCLKGESK